MNRLRIIVTGLIAQYPLGGVTWDYLQYVLGLNLLGHEVFYFEDTGQWPYNPSTQGTGENCDYNVNYLTGVMKRFGLDNNWAYKFPWKSQWFGLSDRNREEVIQSADLLINVSGTLANPLDYRSIPRLIYIDSDPVFTQVKLAKSHPEFEKHIATHDLHFSFGESMSSYVPNTRFNWIPTRQPIVLTEWNVKPIDDGSYTTVMNWTSYKPIKYKGRTFGQKDIEFQKFIDLPEFLQDVSFEIAVNSGKTRRTPRGLLTHKGWRLVDPEVVCPDLEGYRTYIQKSKAEWSVAKNGYVEGQAGWFSCRSACYLASGKPVIVQDTGFGAVLPVGEGLLSFRNLDEAIIAIREVEANYSKHALKARELSEQFFDSSKVLSQLLADASKTPGP